jgi:16S rRNA (adenine1518-N6/adenine1519-N6)-dimethyltransferase
MARDGRMVRAKRSLSQNFLVDPNLRGKLVEALGAGSDDTVLEVGPGHGELSERLVGKVDRLVLVEKDDRLAELLSGRWGTREDVHIVHADALDVDLSRLVEQCPAPRVISNVPYSITSPLLFRFLDIRPLPTRIVVLVQEEVGRRIVAAAGGREYGALSVGIRARADARLAFRIGRKAFRPVPAVDSVAVVIEPFTICPTDRELDALRDLTRVAFSRRRKQIRRILRDAPEYDLSASEADEVLARVGVDPAARPETLAPGRFLQLSAQLRGAGEVPES